ncbi:MAG: 3'-5' exonuclease [Bacteroidetes bacterium QS_7_67_15]|nr:MAG: 3'-5' exonuclease [Bacteroidetes bacterium QS_7_67_15]
MNDARRSPPEEPGALNWAEGPLRLAAYAFFDLETTGLRPDRGARIAEIAVVGRDGVLLDWQRDAEGAQPLPDRLPRLLEELRGRVVVGHHLSFDFRFVAYEARRHELSIPRLPFIDTLGLARRVLGERPNHQLAALLDRFDLAPDGPLHTAPTDAKAARALFWQLVEEAGLDTLADAGVKPLTWAAP